MPALDDLNMLSPGTQSLPSLEAPLLSLGATTPRQAQQLLGVCLCLLGLNILGFLAFSYWSWHRLTAVTAETAQLQTQVAHLNQTAIPLTTPQQLVATNSPAVATLAAQIGSLSTQKDFNTLEGKLVTLVATLTALQTQLGTLEARVAAVEAKPTNIVASKPTSSSPTTTATSSVKEQTVYIGSGGSSSTDWVDIETASVELNSVNYPGIKRVVFEATLSIFGGEASARLKNKTTGGVIYPSQVGHNSSAATVKQSDAFSLAAGSNVYVVQLRSSSSERVVLDGARLRLLYD